VIEYMAQNPRFGRGVKTVSKEQLWVWFVRRFDEIASHMEADDQYMAKMKKRLEKEAAIVMKATSQAAKKH